MPPAMTPGEHGLHIVLHNHANENRRANVQLDTPGWGNGQSYDLPAKQDAQLNVPYMIDHDWPAHVGPDAPPALCVQVTQCPLNFDELDIANEQHRCLALYAQQSACATVAERRFDLA